MDPQHPDNSNTTPTNPAGGDSQPPGSWRIWSRKKMVIALAALVVLVAAIVMLTAGKGFFGGSGQDKASLYIGRPGYENLNNDGIGDPAALISKPSGKTKVQYAGTGIVQPCTLITIKDVREAGLKVSANQLTGSVQRFFFDGVGPAALSKPASGSLPILDDSNACQYSLENKGLVRITVNQEAYVSEQAVNHELSKGFTRVADTGGLATYEGAPIPEDANASTYFVGGKGTIAELNITTPDKTAKQKVLQLLAQRLSASSEALMPLEEFDYSSPIFTSSVPKACDLIDNTSFKAVFGTDSGPLVEEKLGTAVGVIADGDTGGKKYNFVSRDCKRRSPERSAFAKKLIINTETYETVEGAKALFAYSKEGAFTSDLQDVGTIGDEAYFASTAGMENALVVRQGRVIVQLGYFVPDEGDIAAEERIRLLTPIAKTVANKLADTIKD